MNRILIKDIPELKSLWEKYLSLPLLSEEARKLEKKINEKYWKYRR